MSYSVIPTEFFSIRAKKLSKRYRTFKDDLKNLQERLADNPLIGDDLGSGLRKVRLQVDSKGKGKRGGVRIIELVVFCRKEVYLITAYDKSDIENIPKKELKKIVKKLDIR